MRLRGRRAVAGGMGSGREDGMSSGSGAELREWGQAGVVAVEPAGGSAVREVPPEEAVPGLRAGREGL